MVDNWYVALYSRSPIVLTSHLRFRHSLEQTGNTYKRCKAIRVLWGCRRVIASIHSCQHTVCPYRWRLRQVLYTQGCASKSYNLTNISMFFKGAKLDTIIKHIQHIIQTTGDGKCVVFSQWKTVLEILSGGLKRNNIGFVEFGRTKNQQQSVLQFRNDPDISVILLNARTQSRYVYRRHTSLM